MLIADVPQILPLPDVSPLRQRYDVSRRNDATLSQALRLEQIASWHWVPETDTLTWSQSLCRLFGRDPNQLPLSFVDQASLYTPDSWRSLQSAIGSARAHGQSFTLTLEYLGANGSHGWLEHCGEAERDPSGQIIALFGIVRDLSTPQPSPVPGTAPRVDSDTATSASLLPGHPPVPQQQRCVLQETALIEAEKTAILGHLAGAIAHDFNNVLAAVSGSLAMLRRLSDHAWSQEFIEVGQQGIARSTVLIHQLMQFSRSQPAQMVVLEPGKFIGASMELLQLSASVAHPIALDVVCPWHVRADPCQLQLALIGLVLMVCKSLSTGSTLLIGTRAGILSGVRAGDDQCGDAVDIVVHAVPDRAMHDQGACLLTPALVPDTRAGLVRVTTFAEQSGGTFCLQHSPAGMRAAIRLPRVSLPASAIP